MSPNFLTLSAMIVGVASAVDLAFADGAVVAVAAVGFLFAYVLDCADGQLARGQQRSSPFGAWLDLCSDMIIGSCFGIALAIRLENGNAVLSFAVGALVVCSRTIALLTAALAARERTLEWQSRGIAGPFRSVYTALSDTPTVYVLTAMGVLCSSECLALIAVTQAVMLIVQSVAIGLHAFTRDLDSNAS